MPTPALDAVIRQKIESSNGSRPPTGPLPVIVELMRRGSTFGPSPPATPWEAMASLLLTAPELSSLKGVYYIRPKPRAIYPFLIITPISGVPHLTNKPSYPSDLSVQFNVLADGPTGDVDVNVLGRAAYRALAPWQQNPDGTAGMRPPMMWADGFEVGAYPGRERWLEQPGRLQQNQNVWTYMFEYRFMCGMTEI